MPWSSEQIAWLRDTGTRLTASSGDTIEVWELKHDSDERILSSWAKHFRNHYCRDTEIDVMRRGTPHSRMDYLLNMKFPDERHPPGPSIRSGDFAEILISDYVEYLLNYWVPRTRFADKNIRNESPKGCDVIGFGIVDEYSEDPDDTLVIFEVKAKLTRMRTSRLQDAINDSMKDQVRKAESLHAIKQRLRYNNEAQKAIIVERFQNNLEYPYKEIYGAAAVLDHEYYDPSLESKCTTLGHPRCGQLRLIIVLGEQMMQLVNSLYLRAANEA